MKIIDQEGATPLNKDELEGLLLPLKTQGELNKAEKQAIFECQLLVKRSRKLKAEILTISALKKLHQQMFLPVWKWAGEFRRTEKNIGVSPHEIQVQLHQLCENSSFRLNHLKEQEWPEFAAYFHHALVSIHPFPNGNGRHARLATDLLSWKLKLKQPSWGKEDLVESTPNRERYIKALKKADRGELKTLIKFIFSDSY